MTYMNGESTVNTMTRSHRALALATAAAALIALAGCSADGGGGRGGDAACAPKDITVVGQVRNETNPYEKSWLDGGQEFAASVGLKEKRLTYDGESPKQLEQIRQELSTGNPECMVLNVLTNTDADTTPVVKAAQDAGAYVVTQWNKPADLHPWDGYDKWIAHITYDGKDSGYQIAVALFESMGGKGGVIALQGQAANVTAENRFAGLKQALSEYPDITLLDQQADDWDRTKAFDTTGTLLTKHGDAIGGVWAANDDMALGAHKALEAANRTDVGVVGIDAVPEAVQAIADGTMVATVSSDGPWQGGIGLAMGYCALTGELDVADLPNKNREFFAEQVLITKENSADYLAPKANLSDFECGKLFGRVAGPLK